MRPAWGGREIARAGCPPLTGLWFCGEGGREVDCPGVRVVVGRSASCQGCSVCPHQRGWRIGQAGFWAGCWGSCAKTGGPCGCPGLGVPSPPPGMMMMRRKKHTFGLLCSKSISQVSEPSLPPSQRVFLSVTPATQLFILLPLHHRAPVCLLTCSSL